MNMNFVLKLALGVLLATLFVGCVTTHIDWNARVGNYTYDQAVTELGPPDKQTKLTDGERVAEWITRYYGGSTSTVVTPGFYNPGGITYVQTTGPHMYEDSLLLTFSTNNILTRWSKH